MISNPPRASADPGSDEPEDPQLESVVKAMRAMLDVLPPDKQAAAQGKLFPGSAQRAPRVATILKLIPKDRAFSAEDVKKSVESEGLSASAKSIHNALGYLHRTQRIKRIGVGTYLLETGELLQTLDDYGGEPTREEQHDSNN